MRAVTRIFQDMRVECSGGLRIGKPRDDPPDPGQGGFEIATGARRSRRFHAARSRIPRIARIRGVSVSSDAEACFSPLQPASARAPYAVLNPFRIRAVTYQIKFEVILAVVALGTR